MNYSKRSIEVVAKTIYGEARGEYYLENGGLSSFIAIANVIYNRFNQSGEKLIENVCVKPKQFSCWNSNDLNLKVIQNVNILDPLYKICQKTAVNVLSEQWPDITKGATHYYSLSLKNQPYWAIGQYPTFKIGKHIFFKL